MVAALGGPLVANASAATITVNTTTDAAPSGTECEGVAGDCSLRQAINKAPAGSAISLPASATPYMITLGTIALDKALTITGAGARTTTIESNGESGIFTDAGLGASMTVTISGVTLSGGKSEGSGGALDLESADAFINLDDVVLSNDNAGNNGGAIELSVGELHVTDSTLGPDDTATDDGGAIDDNDDGVLYVTDSTVSGDNAEDGGGISTESGATTILSYTTIAFNSALTAGGDLYSDASGGEPGDTVASDTIVADGGAPSGADCNSDSGFTPNTDVPENGYNLTDGIGSSGVAACGFTESTDLLGDARLGPLADNGGPTDTETLAAGSPALDAIPTSNANCTSVDQRGDARPKGTGCDIGALEAGYGETAPQWSVAHDFQTSPLENPSPDSLGHSDVWSYEQGPVADLTVPADYTLMPNSSTDAGACSDLASWNVGGNLPVVDFNATAATIACGTVTVPAHTVVLHPSESDYSIVAWTSPVSGMIAVAGSFVSMDPDGGEGTTWDIDNGSNTIASGSNDVGGSGNFDPAPFAVTSGDTLYFILGPTDSAVNETTELNLTITEEQSPPPSCATSMTVDSVQVLADCITAQGGGTFLASGRTRFGNGASIVDAGTQTPATLVLNPAAHTISIEPASGGAQSGELEAGGVDVATGDLVIATQGVTDPVSGIAGSAGVSGMSSIGLSLSGWTFSNGAIASTVYLAPSSAGGGAIVDGQLALPGWLGDALKFGTLTAEGLVPGVSGQLAVQASSSGQLSVINGGVSFKATVLGDSNLQLANAELSYERAGDKWTGTADLGFAGLVKLSVNGVISDGKLDDLGVNFACATAKICGSSSSLPTIGAILDLKDVDLNMINLQGVDYAPPPTLGPDGFPIVRPACVPTKLIKCPAPQPAPQVDGAVIVGLLGDRVIAGGDFDYLLDGQFTASGGVGLAPLYGSKFSDPPPLKPGQSATNVVDNLLNSGFAGVELGGATIDYMPGGLLQATGTMFLPPPPFPFQFLKGTISIGIDGSHFTGEGSESLVIPKYVPVIGGDTFGSVEALISDEAAAAEATLPQYCVSVNLGFHTYTACSPKITFLASFDWANGKVTVDINGGNINDYATVPQASASAAAAGNSRSVHVPAAGQLASFTIHSRRGTPDVALISPSGAGTRRVLTLATSKKLHNHTGALAWVDSKAHTEGFLVLVPQGGSWKVKRLKGPRIVSVKVMVPRHTIHKITYPHAVERARDLPAGKVSTDKQLTLHYSVPNPGPKTTVELWAGTGPHGAGGVMIADGLPPSGTATWTLSGLATGRYWPYAIVDENGTPVSIQYWPSSVEIVNASAPPAPTGVGTALSSGQAYVYWNEVPTAATYAITATGSGGGAPIRDAVPASQLDAQLTLPAGRWSIAVQAVNAQEQASLPSTTSTITVP